MHPAWRLATSSLAGRRLRTGLLAGAVALAASLITAVACGMASVSVSMTERLDTAVGRADVTLTQVAGAAFDPGLLALVESWPEPLAVAPHSVGPLPLRLGTAEIVVNGTGVDPAAEAKLHRYNIATGRFVENTGEIVIEHRVANTLDATVGDILTVPRFGPPITLTVVGVLAPEALNKMARRIGYVTREQLSAHDSLATRLVRIDIDLPDELDPAEFIAAHQLSLPRGLILEPTERASAGLTQNIRVFQIGLFIWTIFAFLAASFIILTGMTTAVAERQRELAITRCVGATRKQIATAQFIVGAIIGCAGAAVGVPFGITLAFFASVYFRNQLPGGLVVPPLWLGIATLGCVGAGLVGAAWPAWRASRTSPLSALTVRATGDSAKAVRVIGVLGILCVLAQPMLAGISSDNGQMVYWTYISAGAPLMLIGYFLLSVPVIVFTARLLGPPLASVFRLPGALLTGAVSHSPIRNGFTAGSLMTGLALLVIIWTTGRAFLGSWIGSINFPDAFVHSVAGLPDDVTDRLESLEAVDDACAISMIRVKTDFLGVQALKQLSSTFIAFDPEPFFRMTKLEWIEGDEVTARQRLSDGGAVLIAQEFAVARGLGVGDTFPFEFRGQKHEMDIVGVVAAPGLDLVGKYFDVGAQFKEQALHAVFGSRADMIARFGNDAIQFVQIDLSENFSDEAAIDAIREEFKGRLITAGSGRSIKENITSLGQSSLTVASSVAIAAMLIACFGVANVVVAGVHARTFEFGVLRAMGATGGTLARLIAAETLMVAIAASVIGTAMGLQAAYAERLIWKGLAGIDLGISIEADAIGAGALTITVLALLAATPTALRLANRPPRELLTARG